MPTYGVLLRVYTPKLEETPDRVRRAVAHVEQARAVAEKFPRLAHMTIVVPRDHDCGETVRLLEAALKKHDAFVNVVNPEGHHSMEALNQGARAIYPHASHALIVSGKAMSYLTSETLAHFDEAFSRGAKVAGLALPELADIVREGRIQNTFAAWNLDALIRVGFFDSALGVEEIAPSIRMVREYGPCIAPIECDAGTLDIHESETARQRHEEVMRTKAEAQLRECERLGATFETLKAGIIR